MSSLPPAELCRDVRRSESPPQSRHHTLFLTCRRECRFACGESRRSHLGTDCLILYRNFFPCFFLQIKWGRGVCRAPCFTAYVYSTATTCWSQRLKPSRLAWYDTAEAVPFPKSLRGVAQLGGRVARPHTSRPHTDSLSCSRWCCRSSCICSNYRCEP